MASAVLSLCWLKLLHKFKPTEEAGEGQDREAVSEHLLVKDRKQRPFHIKAQLVSAQSCFTLKRMLTARAGAMVPLLLAPKLAKIEFVG